MRMRPQRIALGALMWVLAVLQPVAAQPAPVPMFSGFDHLTVEVSDLGRSRDFYTRVFGFDVWQDNTTNAQYLVLGDAYLRMQEGQQPRITEVGIGIADFELTPVQAFLDREGLTWQAETAVPAVKVEDRDGVRSRLLAGDSWSVVQQQTAPLKNPTSDNAIFRALSLDEVGISVTNLEVDSLFYARLLGRTGALQAGSLWYPFGHSRLRLSQTPVGQHSGVGYFAVLISNTDLEEAANAVFAAGGIIETVLTNGFSFWDPDGLRVLVHTTPML